MLSWNCLDANSPDLINYLCSLTGVCIIWKYFTNRSVQIFKMLFQRFWAPGSDSSHKIMRYWFYSSTLLSRWFPPDQNGQAEMNPVPAWTSSERANRRSLNFLHNSYDRAQVHRIFCWNQKDSNPLTTLSWFSGAVCTNTHKRRGTRAHTHCYTGAHMLTLTIQAYLPMCFFFALCLFYSPSLEEKAKCWSEREEDSTRTFFPLLVLCLKIQLSYSEPQELLQTVSLCASN